MFTNKKKYKTAFKVLDKNPYKGYKKGKALGSGSAGSVSLYHLKGKYIAIKSFSRSNEYSEDDFYTELNGYEKAGSHKYITKVYKVFIDEFAWNIVLEYCPEGSLINIYTKYDLYSERNVRSIIRQCCEGLRYLKKKDIVHRDIKPGNILVRQWTPTIEICIADFNFSKVIKKTKNKIFTTVMGTQLGSHGYAAPEILDENFRKRQSVKAGKTERHYNYKVDVFSLGVVAHELLSYGFQPNLKLPRTDLQAIAQKQYRSKKEKDHEVFKKKLKYFQHLVENGVPLIPQERWRNITEEAKETVKLMIMPVATSRPTYDEILNSAWIKKKYQRKQMFPVRSQTNNYI